MAPKTVQSASGSNTSKLWTYPLYQQTRMIRRDAPVNEDTIIIAIAVLSFMLGFLISDKISHWNEKRKGEKK